MPAPRPTRLLALLVALGASAAAAQGRPPKVDLKRPLIIASQGSFFVGGDTKILNGPDTRHARGHQPDVRPVSRRRPTPTVSADRDGARLLSEQQDVGDNTRRPDGLGRVFRQARAAVYLADQVSRGRSGFDASVFNAVKAGSQPPSQLPNILYASREVAWTVFRFGPTYGTAFPDGQFPVEAADELYKQMIPDLNALLPTPNPTWTNMASLATRLKGAILMGHSESGFFPERAALIDPSGIRGMISIEQPCPADLNEREIGALAKIPTLMVFGDHLGDVRAGPRTGRRASTAARLCEARRGRGRRRADDAPAGAGHPRQQPHADAGSQQPAGSRPDRRLDRRPRRAQGQALIPGDNYRHRAHAGAAAVADAGPARRAGDHPGHRGCVFVVRLGADRRPAPAADRADRSQPARVAAAAAGPERSEPARAGDARHAGHRDPLSAVGLGGAVRAHPPRSGRRAGAPGSGGRGRPGAGAAPVSGQRRAAVLGRVGSHLRARRRGPGSAGARAGAAVAAGAAGGHQLHRGASAGAEQRARGRGRAADPGDLRPGRAPGLLVPGRHAGGHRRHRPAADRLESAALRRAVGAVGGAPGPGAHAHHHARVHAARAGARAARRVRPAADGGGHHARAGGEADAGGLADARRAARDRRGGADGPRQRARAVAGAAPVNPRGAGAGRGRGLVRVERRAPARSRGGLPAQRRRDRASMPPSASRCTVCCRRR